LISAINDSGLGLTASFTTQAEAGVTGGGSETGIQISGGVVSAGERGFSAERCAGYRLCIGDFEYVEV
jgi:hypothetical protein